MASPTTLLNRLEDNLSESEFTRAERRELGLTALNVFRTARKLKKQGLLSKNSKIAAKQVAEALKLRGKPGVDWDKIIEFLTKLMPIILQLLAIFGV